MTNYFEETDQMYIYYSLTDYQKGILDGFLEIANMVEDEIADHAEDKADDGAVEHQVGVQSEFLGSVKCQRHGRDQAEGDTDAVGVDGQRTNLKKNAMHKAVASLKK